MPEIRFFVHGIPVGKPRPKASRIGKSVRIYTPTKTKRSDGTSVSNGYAEWTEAVKRAAEKFRPPVLITTPVVLNLKFYMPRPKFHFGTGRNSGSIKPRYIDNRHATKPDRDNLEKAVSDAISTAGVEDADGQKTPPVFWSDDTLIWDGHCTKLYAPQAGKTGALVEVIYEK